MNETIVIGHINPDTDTTCSAIAYAWYLGQKEVLAKPAIAGEPNKETAFVLTKFGTGTPDRLDSFTAGARVVIVDTNNPDELAPGWQDAVITEIIDHHKLAGLTTPEPIPVTIRPVACTATLIFERMQSENVTIPSDIAGVMLSAILSDTLNFTSPTATEADRAAAKALTALAGVDADALADEMFAAKSDISDLSDEEILLVDGKVYELGGKKMRVSVLETTKPEFALNRKADLLEALRASKTKDGLDGALLFVVDIVKTESTLLIASETEQELAEKAFGVKAADDEIKLPGVVSRKKQMVPKLEEAA